MIIVDQEQTILNFGMILGIRVLQNGDKWSVVALLDMKGAQIALGTYNAEETAMAVRQQLLTALSMGKNLFEMPPDMPEIIIPQDFIEITGE